MLWHLTQFSCASMQSMDVHSAGPLLYVVLLPAAIGHTQSRAVIGRHRDRLHVIRLHQQFTPLCLSSNGEGIVIFTFPNILTYIRGVRKSSRRLFHPAPPLTHPLTLPTIMPVSSSDQAQLRYSQELAQWTLSQFNLAKSSSGSGKENAATVDRPSSDEGYTRQADMRSPSSAAIQDRHPTPHPSGIKVIDFAARRAAVSPKES